MIDLTFIEDGQSTLTDKNLMNVTKLRLISEIISDVNIQSKVIID